MSAAVALPSLVLLTIDQVAERWQCSAKVVRGALARGELRVCRLSPRVLRVQLAEVERYEARSAGARARGRHQGDTSGDVP